MVLDSLKGIAVERVVTSTAEVGSYVVDISFGKELSAIGVEVSSSASKLSAIGDDAEVISSPAELSAIEDDAEVTSSAAELSVIGADVEVISSTRESSGIDVDIGVVSSGKELSGTAIGFSDVAMSSTMELSLVDVGFSVLDVAIDPGGQCALLFRQTVPLK